MPSSFSRNLGTPFIGPGPSRSPSVYTAEISIRKQISYLISGQTLNNIGAPLGNCAVHVYQTILPGAPEGGPQGRFVGSTVSDANGNYSVGVQADPNMTFQATAYLPGSPDVAGITVNTLTPTAS